MTTETMAETTEEASETITGYLPWPEDLQMISEFLDRKDALIEEHSQFVETHPELGAILADFLQSLLIHKPDDVYGFAYDFFAPYSPILPPEPSHLSSKSST
ncbi:PREDICTED: ciliogenesis-associated TTC17-interacting protein-like [Amphimedon queenslandica]|uniref:RIIa domain-containing protein n=1 Tax=Amphimedon queenslandica TaxID=400682 RepID=A0A1X7VRS4_AMPQE|nr:PREDICTED: ciliogenesis-associated TTC17-interacting protein-like [Amphimedon queenslandica]|eukprot:XP_011407155.1 PREDICTED: ciliogenesis-associated TTC17-interacting protein-like [Amphimedon queenslandica]